MDEWTDKERKKVVTSHTATETVTGGFLKLFSGLATILYLEKD